jgi:hypothetical protein
VTDRECRRAERNDHGTKQNPRAGLEADRGPKHGPKRTAATRSGQTVAAA